MEAALNESLRLLRLHQEGDPSALQALVKRYQTRILLTVRARLGRRLRSKVESMDVVQEALMKAIPSLKHFEPRTEGALMHYFSTVIAHHIRDLADYYSAQKRSVSQESPLEPMEADGETQASEGAALGVHSPDRTPSQILQLSEDQRMVEDALDLLPENYREVVICREMDGMDFKEIGEKLGKSPDAARMVFNRAMAELSTLVADKKEAA